MSGVLPVLSEVAGALVVLVTLLDIFLTVLFPASGRGPLRRPLSSLIWHAFRGVAKRLGERRRRDFLAYSGPVMVAVSIAIWPVLIVLGWSLVYLPTLGHGIAASNGPTDTSWPTAFYFSGFTLTTLGTGDVVPTSGFWRAVTVTEAAIGFATVSMVITYFLSLYSAVTQRKTFAATLDHRTHGTGDSTRLLTGLAAQGGTSAIIQQLTSTGEYLENLFQTLQSYPVLRYFHYREIRYALPRVLLVTLDAAALLPAALAGEQRSTLTEGSALAVVRGAAHDLLRELDPTPAGSEDEQAWRRRFCTAVEQFRNAGLDARADPDAIEQYVERRREWDGRVRGLAAAMLYDWEQIEVVGTGG